MSRCGLGLEHDFPAHIFEPFAPFNVLGIEKESLIQSVHLIHCAASCMLPGSHGPVQKLDTADDPLSPGNHTYKPNGDLYPNHRETERTKLDHPTARLISRPTSKGSA